MNGESISIPLLSAESWKRFRILRWIAGEGDFIFAGEDLYEVEYEDKSEAFILTSFDTGVVRILETEGVFSVGEVVGRIDRDYSRISIGIEMEKCDVIHLDSRRGDVPRARYLTELVKKILREDLKS